MIKPLSRKHETSFKGSTSNYSYNRVTLSRGLILHVSLPVRESRTVFDSGFQILGFGLFVNGTWILDSNR